ncbi:MAG: thioesterase family protein [Alphaproteobacteria bacterium]|nr:thioesterase family protein [Alphaproteobacteria bacterium]
MFSNTMTLDIQFGDCDPAGIVYFPNYFRMGDNATAALISAALGMHKRAWLAAFDGAGIPMVDTGARFFKPNRFGDVIEIHSEIAELGRSSFAVRHVLARDGISTVEVNEKRVWTVRDQAGDIVSSPLPDRVRQALAQIKEA